jgi:preprotein translocase subunit SecA
VEGHNYSIRKHLLEYDDVMNYQREIVYDRRNYTLHGRDVNKLLNEIINEYIDDLVEKYCPKPEVPDTWEWEEIDNELLNTFSLDIQSRDLGITSLEQFRDMVVRSANAILAAKKELVDPEQFEEFEKFVILKTIDEKWMDHLHSMDHLREGINLRAYGQKNPLIEYKNEGFAMFAQMMEDTNREVLKRIFRVRIQASEPARRPIPTTVARNVKYTHDDSTGLGLAAPPAGTPAPTASQGGMPARPQKVQPIHVDQKVGKTEPCPCGSGKK